MRVLSTSLNSGTILCVGRFNTSMLGQYAASRPEDHPSVVVLFPNSSLYKGPGFLS